MLAYLQTQLNEIFATIDDSDIESQVFALLTQLHISTLENMPYHTDASIIFDLTDWLSRPQKASKIPIEELPAIKNHLIRCIAHRRKGLPLPGKGVRSISTVREATAAETRSHLSSAKLSKKCLKLLNTLPANMAKRLRIKCLQLVEKFTQSHQSSLIGLGRTTTLQLLPSWYKNPDSLTQLANSIARNTNTPPEAILAQLHIDYPRLIKGLLAPLGKIQSESTPASKEATWEEYQALCASADIPKPMRAVLACLLVQNNSKQTGQSYQVILDLRNQFLNTFNNAEKKDCYEKKRDPNTLLPAKIRGSKEFDLRNIYTAKLRQTNGTPSIEINYQEPFKLIPQGGDPEKGEHDILLSVSLSLSSNSDGSLRIEFKTTAKSCSKQGARSCQIIEDLNDAANAGHLLTETGSRGAAYGSASGAGAGSGVATGAGAGAGASAENDVTVATDTTQESHKPSSSTLQILGVIVDECHFDETRAKKGRPRVASAAPSTPSSRGRASSTDISEEGDSPPKSLATHSDEIIIHGVAAAGPGAGST
jgi:hypothetical protein